MHLYVQALVAEAEAQKALAQEQLQTATDGRLQAEVITISCE